MLSTVMCMCVWPERNDLETFWSLVDFLAQTVVARATAVLKAGSGRCDLPRLSFALNDVESKWACADPARVLAIPPLGGIGGSSGGRKKGGV